MKKFILVCDDDKNLNRDVSETLTQQTSSISQDVEIVSVYSREEAFQQLNKRYFSVAIIDLNLEGTPPMDWSRTGGVKVIQKLRDKGFNTKVIVISASPETELSFNLAKLYAIDTYIQKGKSTSSFRELITKTLEFIKNSSLPVPNDTLEAISGLESDNKTIWETNVCSALDVEGGYVGLKQVADSIIEKYYPFTHVDNKPLKLDNTMKNVTGRIWSYRLAKEVNICISNKSSDSCSNDKSIDEINILNILVNIRSS